MISDCEEGKIDMIITKSISRFARNMQDCLLYSRKLKNLGIGIMFEKEHINTLDSTGELLFTILSLLAQDESRNISEYRYRILLPTSAAIPTAAIWRIRA